MTHLSSLARVLALGAIVLSGPAHAEVMSRAQIAAELNGRYSPVTPAPERFERQFANPELRIFERDGQLMLENNMRLSTKNVPTLYQIEDMECTTEATVCRFFMMIVGGGGNVHFLGVNPAVEMIRQNGQLSLHIWPRYAVLGAMPSRVEVVKVPK